MFKTHSEASADFRKIKNAFHCGRALSIFHIHFSAPLRVPKDLPLSDHQLLLANIGPYDGLMPSKP